MNKTELLQTYTAEQLAEMVVEKEKYIIELENAENLKSSYLLKYTDEQKKRIESLEKQLGCSRNTINSIDYILEKLFGVRHDIVDKPDEFEKILAEKVKGSIEDFLPSEPIKVADMLISATYTRQKSSMEKTLHKAFGNNSDTVTENVYSESELRQIAEHLLVYCNHNEGDGNEES